MASVTFATSAADLLASVDAAEVLVVVAPAASLKDGSAWSALAGSAAAAVLASPVTLVMAQDASPSITGSSISTYVSGSCKLGRLVFVALPDSASRLYSDTHSMAISGGLCDAGLTADTTVLVVLPTGNAVEPAACAIARATPLFTRKTSAAPSANVVVGLVGADGLLTGPSVSLVAPAAFNAVRMAARLAETPTEQMNTDAVEAEAREAVADIPNVEVYSIVGDDLLAAGLNAIHTVGRTSLIDPRLVVLKLTPTDPVAAAAAPIGLVGKGIVYDTGGLSLKGDGGRLMKDDMTGAAGVLGAFTMMATLAAHGDELSAPLYAALCLAENCIGPHSYRPDDILTMHSGLTVEVIDTDAEGRFVVGDGCSYLAREKRCTTLIDAATLTGTTGFTARYHGVSTRAIYRHVMRLLEQFEGSVCIAGGDEQRRQAGAALPGCGATVWRAYGADGGAFAYDQEKERKNPFFRASSSVKKRFRSAKNSNIRPSLFKSSRFLS